MYLYRNVRGLILIKSNGPTTNAIKYIDPGLNSRNNCCGNWKIKMLIMKRMLGLNVEYV